LGIVVEDCFKVLNSGGVQGCIGELGSPNSHATEDLVDDADSAAVEGLAGGRDIGKMSGIFCLDMTKKHHTRGGYQCFLGCFYSG
jgi:hypothetical protein